MPRIERVLAETMPDGRLLLQIKDAPFSQPVLARSPRTARSRCWPTWCSSTIPTPPPFIGIEEPENFLHPRLLPELAEECRAASERTQLLVTTHSPFFLNGLRPEEVRVLCRDEQGYTQTRRAADMRGVPEFVEQRRAAGPSVDGGPLRRGRSAGQPGAPTRPPEDAGDDGAAPGVPGRGALDGGFPARPAAAAAPRTVPSRSTPSRARTTFWRSCQAGCAAMRSGCRSDWRIVVVVDRDDDDCVTLKAAPRKDGRRRPGCVTRSQAGAQPWQLVNRIAIEELEAWYFGDWEAVCSAYPRVSPTIPQRRRGYRDPDAIQAVRGRRSSGFCSRHRYFRDGLRKIGGGTSHQVPRVDLATHTGRAASSDVSAKPFAEADGVSGPGRRRRGA